ncbi:hypothetical protein IIB51_03090 [Patescibacteria group bacterium]|nr:hypothetical protein [Patescibacteria group bacterium]MCH8889222.1 hypothetical protein [Patescibacteria group bacterium]
MKLTTKKVFLAGGIALGMIFSASIVSAMPDTTRALATNTTECREETMYGIGSEGETYARTLNLGDITGISKLY